MNRAHPGVLLLVLHEVIVQDGDEHVDGGEHDEEEVGGHVEEGQAVVAALHRLVAHDREVAAREVPGGAIAQQLSGQQWTTHNHCRKQPASLAGPGTLRARCRACLSAE